MASGYEGISPEVTRARIDNSYIIAGVWTDPEYVLTIIVDGEATFIIDGKSYFVKPDDVIIMKPMAVHIIKDISEKSLLSYVMHFNLQDNEDNLINKKSDFFKGVGPILSLDKADMATVKSKFMQIHNELMHRKTASDLLMKGMCIELLAYCLRGSENESIKRAKATPYWYVLEKAMSYIYENHDNPNLNNAIISKSINASESYVSQAFRNSLNISVHKYLNYVRIDKAKTLLLQGDLSVTQIAELCGYNSVHIFSKVFKKFTGITPTEYVKNSLY